MAGKSGESDTNLRLKQAYRQLEDVVNDAEKAVDLVKPGSDALVNILKQGDELFGQVESASSGANDSRLMIQIAQLGKRKFQELKADPSHFTANDFVDQTINFSLQERRGQKMEADDWTMLGAAVQNFFKRPCTFAYMLGSFSRDPLQKKERVVRQRVADDNSKDKRTNVKLVIDDQEQLETTAHDVSRRILPELINLYKHAKEPLDYYDFVIDPDSFGVTVENMFHISFLIRDGWAEISLDDEKLPVIKPTIYGMSGSREDKDKELQAIPRKQLINHLTVDQWKRLKEAYKITKARIPRRSALKTARTSSEASQR